MIGLAIGASPFRASAADDSGPELIDESLTADYPAGVTFKVETASNVDITHITLRFGTTSTTTTCQDAVAIRELDVVGDTQATAEYTWDFRISSTVPPGAEVWWEWEITDRQSRVLRTERRHEVLMDQRFTWQTVSADNLTIYWAEGDQAFGQHLLELARDAADSLRADAGLAVSEPVRLTIYPDFEVMRQAVLQVAEWTGGLAYPNYNAILIGIAPDQTDWAAVVIPHEYTHLVTGAATDNCLGVYMPTWLNEGLSMHTEATLGATDDDRLRERAQNGTLPPLRELANGFSADSDDANAAYAQSGRVVTFMLEAYGAERMSALLAAIRAGQPIDPALQATYGLDTDGVDAAWRATLLGDPTPTAAPALSPTVQPTATAVPTIVAWNGVPTPLVPTLQPTVAVTPTPAPNQPTGAIDPSGYLGLTIGLLTLACLLCLFGLAPVVLGVVLWFVFRERKS